MKNSERLVVDSFEIPEELAKELSKLLTRQTIRERLLDRMLQQGDQAGFENVEELLIPITNRIEAIKTKITEEFVPATYNSQEYMWNYEGWEIYGNRVQIIKVQN